MVFLYSLQSFSLGDTYSYAGDLQIARLLGRGESFLPSFVDQAILWMGIFGKTHTKNNEEDDAHHRHYKIEV